MPSVIGTLEATINNLLSRYGGEVAAQHVGQARAIIDILQAKVAGAQQ
jgi:ubiquinone biosynthesis protein UbiJ